MKLYRNRLCLLMFCQEFTGNFILNGTENNISRNLEITVTVKFIAMPPHSLFNQHSYTKGFQFQTQFRRS